MNNEPTTVPMTQERRERFEHDLDQMRVRTGSGAVDAKLAIIGLAMMGVGVAIALAAYLLSGGQSDSRDVISSVILAIFGATVVVAGAAVFLRYSLGSFLRLWLLRLIYELQSDT